ncbi:unnamed protein product [Urochloa humidicola]
MVVPASWEDLPVDLLGLVLLRLPSLTDRVCLKELKDLQKDPPTSCSAALVQSKLLNRMATRSRLPKHGKRYEKKNFLSLFASSRKASISNLVSALPAYRLTSGGPHGQKISFD